MASPPVSPGKLPKKHEFSHFFTPRKILKKEGKNTKIEDVKLSWAVLVRVYVKACAARN